LQAISAETSSNFYAVLQIIFKKEKAREQVMKQVRENMNKEIAEILDVYKKVVSK